ncbi:MAG: RNA 2',3'-cyclic phosphodiesterase [Anaerolineae bacterium]
MRLFIAVELPEAAKDRVMMLKTELPHTTWTRRETYHITLRFLGDGIDESRIPELQTTLAAIQLPAFELQMQGVGRFPPNPKKPARVLWVGIVPNPRLNALYDAVERRVTTLGFPADDHAFGGGHITLARLKLLKPEPRVDAFLSRHAQFKSEPFPVTAFYLFNSVLTPNGPQYQIMGTFNLISGEMG